MTTALLLSLFLGYLLGSIPVAYLVARARGVDIFAVGTGNPGAANTFRSVGRLPGFVVFALDALKAAVAVAVAAALGVEAPEMRVLAGAAAVTGHWYPVFLRFRGGAGLAPLVGLAFATVPLAALAGAIPAALFLIRSHNTGYAAGIGFAILLIAGILLGEPVAAAAVWAVAFAVLLHTKLVTERRMGARPTGPL